MGPSLFAQPRKVVQPNMKTVTMPVPEMAAIAATRGLLGAGIGMVMANRIRPSKRLKIGWPLLLIGAITTIPFAWDVLKNRVDRG
jgi:hypothetical protein